MREISVAEFRSTLRTSVEAVVGDHMPLRVKRRGGKDFVVVSAEDWEREQETLYVLQNPSLMQQIERSNETHRQGSGYRPTAEELPGGEAPGATHAREIRPPRSPRSPLNARDRL